MDGASSARTSFERGTPTVNMMDSHRKTLVDLATTRLAEPHRTYSVPDGMPLAVFQDKYARLKRITPDGTKVFETWEERLRDVTIGNFLVDHELNYTTDEFRRALELGVSGVMGWSGRHLQQGGLDQPSRSMELFSNCSTSIFSFTNFWLLLNGSGVGSDYSTYTRRVNWDNMPGIRLVLDGGVDDMGDPAEWCGAHRDYAAASQEFTGAFESLREAQHKYPSDSERVRWFKVEDSREGWVQIVSALETAAFHEKHRDKLFIFDFSGVRPSGAPIVGQQNRPASGPIPLMRALLKVASIKGAGMAPWKQALFIDDYLAAVVAMGGVRRSARMATKWWKDNDILEFIEIKRGGHLRTANNSILVDDEFWAQTRDKRTHAWRVFQAATAAAYLDRTGEPGFINVSKLACNVEGMDTVTAGNYINPNSKLKVHRRTRDMMENVLDFIKDLPPQRRFIVNPCAEIVLALYGAYCVIGDVSLAHARTLQEARDGVRLMAHSMVRVNMMESLYRAEVGRTNRIGVGLLGIYEFAWNFFRLTFRDLISVHDMVFEREKVLADKSDAASLTEWHSLHDAIVEYDTMPRYRLTGQPISGAQCRALLFWQWIDQLRRDAEEGALDYSHRLGVNPPHTFTTLKPAGTAAKALNVTEAANLPAVLTYLRWVQYPKTTMSADGVAVRNPDVAALEARGYPVRDVSHQYTNVLIVGFPTKKAIVDVIAASGMHIDVAAEVSVEDHYRWLRLLERFWLSVDERGAPRNNQISYTLKYLADRVTYDEFSDALLANQHTIRCCSFDAVQSTESLISAYAYVPEEPITVEAYIEMMKGITQAAREDYDENLLACEGGVCPIEPDRNHALDLESAGGTP